MKQEIIKDRWGMLIAFGMYILLGTYGVIVFILAGIVALVHLVRTYQKSTIKLGV